MPYNNLLYQPEGAACLITINRPDKLNALNMETIRELASAIRAAGNDDSIRGIILTGAGPKAFVAGADIAEFAGFGEKEAEAMAQSGHDAFRLIEGLSKPVIAAVNGFALGGGCELALSCHIRIASSAARFSQPEVNLGIIPGYGGTQRLTRLIGRGKATELLLTGDMVAADEAKALGLVNHVTEPDALLAKCREILDKISQKSPLVAAQILGLVDRYYDKKEDGFAAEVREFTQCFGTADFREGVEAFLNKRKASFTGR